MEITVNIKEVDGTQMAARIIGEFQIDENLFPFTAIAIRVLIRFRAYWQDQTSRFLLLWFLFVLSFFSLSGTKLPHYILYGLPALFLLMGRELESFKNYRWVFVPAAVFFGLLGAACLTHF